ncbi:MAG TPA: ATP-binding protein [Kofleriaceae bacterium]
MQLLASRLELSTAELDTLWLLACIELEPMVACVAQQLLVMNTNTLTVQLLERLVALGGEPFDSKAIARLTQLGLVETSTDSQLPLFRRPIRVSDRVLALARGELGLDDELAAVAVLEPAVDAWRHIVPDTLPAELRQTLSTEARCLVVAYGVDGSGRTTLLRQAIAATGRAVVRLHARDLATEQDKLVRQLRAVVRECRLHGAWPLVSELDLLGDRASVVQHELLDRCGGPVFATCREPCTWRVARPVISFGVEVPDAGRRLTLWRSALAGANEEVIRSCAERYTITAGLLSATAASVAARHADRSAVAAADVHLALRGQLERRLLGLATRVETRQTWQDLVLPVDQFDLLIELASRIRHRKHVLETWGFADKVGRGVGVSALFSGPPGTGKTMIAGLLANELGLDLYQVDLSRVVSKYIGETEKQLAALFEAAESGHAIILFDEADSLFGKRTEVKSSNDRYANLEVNYLLQRMEAFKGITLLTTNHEAAIDPAFQRRLAFHVRVPIPDREHRELLWRSMIPDRAQCAGDLDTAALAEQFVMTGGYIKNAALRAAYLAASEGGSITHEHLRRAARAEYEAMGKVSYQPAA